MKTPPNWDIDHPAVQAWQRAQRRKPWHIRHRGAYVTVGMTTAIVAGGFAEQRLGVSLSLLLFLMAWSMPAINDIITGQTWDD